jgi:peptide chain release factor subunit 1
VTPVLALSMSAPAANAASSSTPAAASVRNAHAERFLLRRRLRELQAYEGSNTSMVSLCISGNYQLSLVTGRLTEELGKSSNIRDRVNRQSVQEAIGSALEKLKTLAAKSPPTGLCLFSGSAQLGDGRTKKIVHVIVPPQDVGMSYRCDKLFHVEPLLEQLENDTSQRKVGFLIVDGSGALYGTVHGTSKRVLYSFEVTLQGKTGRGGQSANRHARNREIQRDNYTRIVCEHARKYFLDEHNDFAPTVETLYVAGSGLFKNRVCESNVLDERVRKLIHSNLLDVQYGGNNGFQQAVDLAQGSLGNSRLVEERTLLTDWMAAIAKDGGGTQVVFGVRETMEAYADSVTKQLIVWDQLPDMRYTVQLPDGTTSVTIARKPPMLERGATITDEVALVEWLVEHGHSNGTEITLVTDVTPQGAQFAQGFGGLGGYLLYAWQSEEQLDIANSIQEGEEDSDDDGFI